MNLIYSILWFENEMESMEPLVDEIKDFVENLGFKFSTPHVEEQGGENFNNIKYEDYDLILMDYKLNNNENGDALIERIRNHQVYTDIIFYSSSTVAELRQAIHNKGIDGVYCVSRSSEPFLSKVQSVIKSTVKKILDLNNMRGLVMAEVSDCDEKMKQIISLHISNQDAAISEQFLMQRKEKLIKSVEEKLKQIVSEPLETFYQSWHFDASHKWRAVKNIVKTCVPPLEACTNCYENEIIVKRNRLGHIKESINDNGEKCLADGDFIFSDEVCKEILSDLKKHSDNLDSIIQHLQP